jgi:hypothetical protein
MNASLSRLPPDMLRILMLSALRFPVRVIFLKVSGTRIRRLHFMWVSILPEAEASLDHMIVQDVKIPDRVAAQRASPPCVAHQGNEYVSYARGIFWGVAEKSLANELMYLPSQMT